VKKKYYFAVAIVGLVLATLGGFIYSTLGILLTALGIGIGLFGTYKFAKKPAWAPVSEIRTSTAMRLEHCQHCGAAMPTDSVFCEKCGWRPRYTS